MKTVSNTEFGCKVAWSDQLDHHILRTPGEHTHRAKYELNPTSKHSYSGLLNYRHLISFLAVQSSEHRKLYDLRHPKPRKISNTTGEFQQQAPTHAPRTHSASRIIMCNGDAEISGFL
ncbi:uncharacterized protein Bfra_000683 [Botrytis fragariae]|uniref:Uncharacterized protein n=1 Tax=Botrytis fragariae TaxID=1964551 RepID=A0A8H6B317_9HELO|nr:uncharacterized protein Bfra_000683 [Botrytis fragariae]KAF5878516.1 hypothetical protein Bfra_000683 [Botrytis fragariae]